MVRAICIFSVLLFAFTSPNDPSDESTTSYTGLASYYASFFEGRLTASGEKFSNDDLTCAHKSLPFGTLVKVTRPDINKSIVVRVNDRGPFVKGREIDLSQKAADELNMFQVGVCKVEIVILPEDYTEEQEMIITVELDTLAFDHLELRPAKEFQ